MIHHSVAANVSRCRSAWQPRGLTQAVPTASSAPILAKRCERSNKAVACPPMVMPAKSFWSTCSSLTRHGPVNALVDHTYHSARLACMRRFPMKLSRLATLSLNRPLREVFWLYGAVPSNLFWASILFLFQRGASLGTLALLFAALMIYTTWILIQIWLCADNVKNPLFGV